MFSWRFETISSATYIMKSGPDMKYLKYIQSPEISKMELFTKIVNDLKPQEIFAKSSILDV